MSMRNNRFVALFAVLIGSISNAHNEHWIAKQVHLEIKGSNRAVSDEMVRVVCFLKKLSNDALGRFYPSISLFIIATLLNINRLSSLER